VQIQALIAGGAGTGRGVKESNAGSHMEVAKPPIFNGEVERVGGFITIYRLCLRIKIKEAMIEEQIQWILSYV